MQSSQFCALAGLQLATNRGANRGGFVQGFEPLPLLIECAPRVRVAVAADAVTTRSSFSRVSVDDEPDSQARRAKASTCVCSVGAECRVGISAAGAPGGRGTGH
jgi:hypothetical protein